MMPRVAVVRSDSRRGAVAQALALVADDLRRVVADEVLIKPNLVSHVNPTASTHADTLSATLDAMLDAGARRAVVAEGASDATAGFRRFGHIAECHGRPIRFLDLNRDEDDWRPLELLAVDGRSTRTARLSGTVEDAGCRVSLAIPKTHVVSTITLSLKNMLSSIHPADRVRMHGHAGGNGSTGLKGCIVEILKQDYLPVMMLTRLMGRIRGRGSIGGQGDYADLSPRDLAFLDSVRALHANIARLSARVKPHVSVVDGFVGMHREGPRHGTPIRLGMAIAGTDAVAVDAVAAAVMGFDPRVIGFLRYADAAGLGVADLDRIEVVGDPIAAVQKRFVPHSNERVLRHWDHDGMAIPRPHAAAVSR